MKSAEPKTGVIDNTGSWLTECDNEHVRVWFLVRSHTTPCPLCVALADEADELAALRTDLADAEEHIEMLENLK